MEQLPKFEEFGKELTRLINKYGLDNWTNTADYLIASMLVNQITNFHVVMNFRDESYAFMHNWSTVDAN